MRRGVFGGSFDPIHLGHLLLAETAWEELELDSLLFIPAHRSPFKNRWAATAEQRWEMLNLAIYGRPGFEASRIELERTPPSYTVDTLRQLVSVYPNDEITLILGADSIKDFSVWRESNEILALADIAVGQRSGQSANLPQDLSAYGHRIRFLSGPSCELSSTDIRERVAAGRTIRYRVPLLVEEYIKENGIYLEK